MPEPYYRFHQVWFVGSFLVFLRCFDRLEFPTLILVIEESLVVLLVVVCLWLEAVPPVVRISVLLILLTCVMNYGPGLKLHSAANQLHGDHLILSRWVGYTLVVLGLVKRVLLHQFVLVVLQELVGDVLPYHFRLYCFLIKLLRYKFARFCFQDGFPVFRLDIWEAASEIFDLRFQLVDLISDKHRLQYTGTCEAPGGHALLQAVIDILLTLLGLSFFICLMVGGRIHLRGNRFQLVKSS